MSLVSTHAAYAVGFAILSSSCLSATVVPVANNQALDGWVLDQAGLPIANAQVTERTSGTTAHSDATGWFEITGNANTPMLVDVEADNYNGFSRRIAMPLDANSDRVWTLHEINLDQDVVLPKTGDASLQLSVVSHTGGKFTVTIPPNALADANGTVVTGAAHVQLTYWDPQSDVDTGPGALVTTRQPQAPHALSRSNLVSAPDGLRKATEAVLYEIDSFGMARLAVSRNGPLNVAVGASIGEQWVLPNGQPVPGEAVAPGQPANADQHQRFLAWVAAAPQDVGLWNYDYDTGLWNMLANMQSNTVSFDATTWTISVQVTNIHDVLNVDLEPGTTSHGGAVRPYCALSVAKHEGEACKQTSDCCPQDGTLVCADDLCVPSHD